MCHCCWFVASSESLSYWCNQLLWWKFLAAYQVALANRHHFYIIVTQLSFKLQTHCQTGLNFLRDEAFADAYWSSNCESLIPRKIQCIYTIYNCDYCVPVSPSSHAPQEVSPTLPHAPMVCAVSVVLASDCCVFPPHYWECMQHNRWWVLHPHIF